MKNSIWHPFTQIKNNIHFPKVLSAKGAFLHLDNGKKLLDMICSWWVTIHGHSHPKIAKAIYKQAKKLEQVIFANFTHSPAIELIQKLKNHLPKSLDHFFFSDNGSTAIEVAIKMTYQYWQNLGESKRKYFICFEGAYHGDTLGAMSISAESSFNSVFKPLLFEVLRAPFPSTYDNDEKVIEKEEKAIKNIEKLLETHKGQIAAIIIEPLVQGAGGMKMCRQKFLQKVQKIAKSYNVLLIYDEVLTGFGRTGSWFASVKSKTAPDIICLSKGLTGGFLPLSLTVCNDTIYQAFCSDDIKKTFFHGHSYTANPIGCAAANASIDLLEKNCSFEEIEALHKEFLKPFHKNQKIKNIRTCGTIAAFDMISNNKSGYFNPIGKEIQKKCFEKGLFIRPLGNVIYFIPPYCITKKQLQWAYNILEAEIKNTH